MADTTGKTAPGRGYEETVKKQHGLGDSSGRGAPDERRGLADRRGRGDNLPGSGEDSALPVAKTPEEEKEGETK